MMIDDFYGRLFFFFYLFVKKSTLSSEIRYIKTIHRDIKTVYCLRKSIATFYVSNIIGLVFPAVRNPRE